MKAIFIVGTGRSGTHFTARLLNGFEKSYDPLQGKERPLILSDIARAAIHHRLPSRCVADYYRKNLSQAQGVFIDQHHPNLFFVEHWSKMFDDIIFLYPRRPVCQIVASMLRHKDVLSWYAYAQHWRRRWIERVPYPNQFLGLPRFSDISYLPPHLLCAHRVIAHLQAYQRAPMAAGAADIRGVDYEALIDNPMAEFSRVFNASELHELGGFSLVEKPRKESLLKYRDILDERQVSEIEALEQTLLDV